MKHTLIEVNAVNLLLLHHILTNMQRNVATLEGSVANLQLQAKRESMEENVANLQLNFILTNMDVSLIISIHLTTNSVVALIAKLQTDVNLKIVLPMDVLQEVMIWALTAQIHVGIVSAVQSVIMELKRISSVIMRASIKTIMISRHRTLIIVQAITIQISAKTIHAQIVLEDKVTVGKMK